MNRLRKLSTSIKTFQSTRTPLRAQAKVRLAGIALIIVMTVTVAMGAAETHRQQSAPQSTDGLLGNGLVCVEQAPHFSHHPNAFKGHRCGEKRSAPSKR
jgi:steroid 5-alpha reductase family enzyme